MADLEYFARLNNDQVLAALIRIDKGIDKLAADADKSFQKVGKSANLSGVQIGAISGLVSSLTSKFIELGHKMAQALSQGVKESVTLATELETTEAIFTGIFQGKENAATGALARIRKESRELGVDLGETARAFLPFVKSLDQLTQVGKISAALAISQPEQGALGARVALQEFLAGSSLSLVKRFEIPKNLGKELNEAIATGGVEEGLKKLDEILTNMGRNIDNLGDTAQLSFGKAAISAQQLQTAFGQPILDELKAQFDDLNVIVAENFDDYTLIADTFGRILAHIVDIVGSGLTDFLANLDTEQVIEIAETLFDIVENARLFAQVLSDTDVSPTLLDNIQAIAEGLETALDTAIKLAGIVTAQAAREAGKAKALEDLGLPARSAGVPTELLLSEEQKALVEAAGDKAYRDSILKTVEAIEESTKRKEENRKATDDLAASQKESTQAGEDEANAHLEQAAAARSLADALEGIAAAEQEAAEKTAKAVEKNALAVEDATTDHQQKLSDISVEAERKRFDAAVDFANKRVDLARDNLQRISDIEKKNSQAISDSNLELKRDLQDIARDTARARIDQAKDEAKKQLDIEVDHLRRVQDVKRRFELDADEFERRRDAVGFLAALRQRDRELSEATLDRERTIADTRLEGQRKREELRLQEQQQREDARIAAAQRLEDLQTDLERELEAQRTNYARAQEELTLAEQRKAEELKLWQERQISDANTAFERRLADLQLALDRELAAIQAAEELKRAEYEATAAAAQAAAAATSSKPKKPSTTGGKAAGFGSNPGTITGKQFGGLVNRGQAVPVGERGPELFTPNANGRIIPNNALVMPSFTPKSVVSNISNSRTNAPAVNFPVGDASLFNDPIFTAKLRNYVLSMIDGVS